MFPLKDTGIGIPRDAQKLIWDRFYKSDLSRGKDKKGTGLGLSIVKEIITAHNEHINVISTEGEGSEFIFSLQKSAKMMTRTDNVTVHNVNGYKSIICCAICQIIKPS